MKIEEETRYLVEIVQKESGIFRDKVSRDTKDYAFANFQYQNGNASPPTSVTFFSETTDEEIEDIWIEKITKAKPGKWFEYYSGNFYGEARITPA